MESETTILVVDDDPAIAELMRDFLEAAGFRVETAGDAQAAQQALEARLADCLLIDVMLPGPSGFELCRWVRQRWDGPILFLSANDEDVNKIRGLGLGGDDYIVKTATPAEVVARVKAVLRRADGGPSSDVLQAGGVTIDAGRREVVVDGEVVLFTTKEFDLLRFLAERTGLALSRQQILDGVWGYDWFGDARTVDVHIAQVRRKVADAVQISTVRGVGYRLDTRR